MTAKTVLPKIISVSRRGDIAAFYSTWLINRIREGFCHYQNPFGGKIHRISLRPDDCAGFVFWTRNPSPLFNHINELRNQGASLYFQFTITGYPHPIESNTANLSLSIERFKTLSEIVGSKGVIWRYDPILLSGITTEEFHLKSFSSIASQLQGKTEICTTSFTDFYGKTRTNLSKLTQKHGIKFDEPSDERKRELSGRLHGIAIENGMELRSCCDASLHRAGLLKASCVSSKYLNIIGKDSKEEYPDKPSRPGCGCQESIDIGAYDTCPFGCSYCYATRNRETALCRLHQHDPNDTILFRPAKYVGIDLTAVALTKG